MVARCDQSVDKSGALHVATTSAVTSSTTAALPRCRVVAGPPREPSLAHDTSRAMET